MKLKISYLSKKLKRSYMSNLDFELKHVELSPMFIVKHELNSYGRRSRYGYTGIFLLPQDALQASTFYKHRTKDPVLSVYINRKQNPQFKPDLLLFDKGDWVWANPALEIAAK